MINLKINESIEYKYTGKCQSIILPNGTYKLECYGAKGGGGTAGYGGYTSGVIKVLNSLQLFLYIGGIGINRTGGWNGGETVSDSLIYGGGGSTDISLQGNDNSTNWNNDIHLNSRILIAKGGDGQGYTGGTTQGTANRTQADAWTSFIDRSGVQAMEITPTVSGTLVFYSYSYAADPWGFIDTNGINIGSNDDGGSGLNFYLSVHVNANQKYILRVGAYSRAGSCNWRATYPDSHYKLYTIIANGGIGGGLNYVYEKNTYKNYPTSQCNIGTKILNHPITIEDKNNGEGKIVITRILDDTRLNSNYYKDCYYQEPFDFNKLIGGE